MRRMIEGEVVPASFDESPVRHVQMAEIVIEEAKRMAENRRDVVVVLDSIMRLARAYQQVRPPSKALPGGVGPGALQESKRFFGAAHRLEEGGSPSIVATALIGHAQGGARLVPRYVARDPWAARACIRSARSMHASACAAT